METSLHRELKSYYAESEDAVEVRHGAYRIDAIRDDELIEIQFASLSSIRDKVAELVAQSCVRIVKPIVERRRIVRQDEPDGPVVSRRLSPKRGSPLDLFDELVFLTRVFPHPNLTIEVPMVNVEEWRLPPKPRKRRRGRFRPKHQVKDVILQEIVSTHVFSSLESLLQLIQVDELPNPFDTSDLAKHLQRSRPAAQRIAYFLRKTGAVKEQGKRGNAMLYARRKRRAS